MTTRVFRGITYEEKIATSNNQTLFGKSGDDWLNALGGNNIVFAGEGDNVVLAGVTLIELSHFLLTVVRQFSGIASLMQVTISSTQVQVMIML